MGDLSMTGCLIDDELKTERTNLKKYRPRNLVKLAYEGVCSRYFRPFLSKLRPTVSSSSRKTRRASSERDSKLEGVSQLFEEAPVLGKASGSTELDSELGIDSLNEDKCNNPEPNRNPTCNAEDELTVVLADCRINQETRLITDSDTIIQGLDPVSDPQTRSQKAAADVAATENTGEETMLPSEKDEAPLAEFEQKRVTDFKEQDSGNGENPWERVFTLEAKLTKLMFAWERAYNEVLRLREKYATLRKMHDCHEPERFAFEEELGLLNEQLAQQGLEGVRSEYKECRATAERASLPLEDIQSIRNYLLGLNQYRLENTTLADQLQQLRAEIISLETDNKLHRGHLTYANTRINELKRENIKLKEALAKANEDESRQLEDIQTQLNGLSRFSMLSNHTAEETFLEAWAPIKSQLALNLSRYRRRLLTMFSINHNECIPCIRSVEDAIREVQGDSINAELLLRLGKILVQTLERNQGLEWVLNSNVMSKKGGLKPRAN